MHSSLEIDKLDWASEISDQIESNLLPCLKNYFWEIALNGTIACKIKLRSLLWYYNVLRLWSHIISFINIDLSESFPHFCKSTMDKCWLLSVKTDFHTNSPFGKKSLVLCTTWGYTAIAGLGSLLSSLCLHITSMWLSTKVDRLSPAGTTCTTSVNEIQVYLSLR